MPVTVAGVRALGTADAGLGAANRVRVGAHERLHERREHLAKQIRCRSDDASASCSDSQPDMSILHNAVIA